MKLRNSIRPIRLLLLLSGLLALASCRQDETQSLSEYLDYVIENKHIFEAEKEERISRLRNLLGVSNLTPEQEYEINTKNSGNTSWIRPSATSNGTSKSPGSWTTKG